MARFNEVRVTVDFDQTLSDSDNIESITPTGNPKTVHIAGIGNLYCVVNSTPQYSEGQPRFSPVAAQTFAGFPKLTYTQPRMHKDTLSYLRTNYRGQVTCSVSLDSTTYTEWNAFLSFNANQIQNEWFEVQWVFTLLETVV